MFPFYAGPDSGNWRHSVCRNLSENHAFHRIGKENDRGKNGLWSMRPGVNKNDVVKIGSHSRDFRTGYKSPKKSQYQESQSQKSQSQEVHKGDSAPTTAPLTASPKSRPVQGQTSDFTELEKEIKLSFLGVLREFPLLWRQDDPLYLDKWEKKKAWEDILSEMKAKHGDDKLGPLNIHSIDDLHRVYEGLRAGLRRVHSEQKKKINMGEVKGGNS